MFLVSDLICHLVIRALWIRGLQLRPHGHRPRTGLSWRPTLTCVWEILIRHMTKQEGERGCHSLLMLIKGQLFIVLLIIVSDSHWARLNISDNLWESHWGRGGSRSEGGGAVEEERKESETEKRQWTLRITPPSVAHGPASHGMMYLWRWLSAEVFLLPLKCASGADTPCA